MSLVKVCRAERMKRAVPSGCLQAPRPSTSAVNDDRLCPVAVEQNYVLELQVTVNHVLTVQLGDAFKSGQQEGSQLPARVRASSFGRHRLA